MSAATIIESARAEGRTLLDEVESKQLLEESGIPTTKARLATTRDEAIAMAGEIGFPVVLKVVSPDVAHKSDAGGVRLDLGSPEAVGEAFDGIMAAVKRAVPDARIAGVSVQTMAKPGTEVIVGLTTDPQFGPVLMFGLGGIFVELLKDVAFRIVPLEPKDAKEMIREIKGFPVLEGFRGTDPADLAALEDVILKVSEFAGAHPEVKELDLNPVFAYRDGAIAVDARVVIE
jgi:acyl-CoA synthetase (NDP forming)